MITNQLREQSSTYALSKMKFLKNLAYFRFILLLLGDINLHPGPIKHPCTICSKAVKKIQISCIKCSLWIHKKCIQLSGRAETYNNTSSFTCQPCLAKEILVSNNIWNHLPFSNYDHPLEDPQKLLNNTTHTPETNLESCLENDQWKTFDKHGPHLIHLNINNVLPKIDELREIAKKTRATVIGLTETKLDATILDGEVNIEGYELIRSDRNRHGGGVACYIKNDVAFRSRGRFSNEIENLFFDILLPKTKPILVGIVYRPPNQSRFLERLTSDITNTNDFDNLKVYILGDLNINLVNNKKHVPNGIKKYREFCSQHGLKQLITSPIRITMTSTSLLYHILTNSSERVSQSAVADVGLSDLQMTYCTTKITRLKCNTHRFVKTRSFKNCSKDSYLQELENAKFPECSKFTDINYAYSDFIGKLTTIINKVAPVREMRI